jgi:hypothetical protein
LCALRVFAETCHPFAIALSCAGFAPPGKYSRPKRAVFPILRAVIRFNRRRCAATTLTFPVRGSRSGRFFSSGPLSVKFYQIGNFSRIPGQSFPLGVVVFCLPDRRRSYSL